MKLQRNLSGNVSVSAKEVKRKQYPYQELHWCQKSSIWAALLKIKNLILGPVQKHHPFSDNKEFRTVS